MSQYQPYQPYQQQPLPREQMIKVYTARWPSYSAVKSFQRDAKKQAKQGWRVLSQSSLEKVNWFQRGITVVYVR